MANPHSFFFHQEKEASEKKIPSASPIQVIAERAIQAPELIKYLSSRCIPLELAQQYCREMDFTLYGKLVTALGFKNDNGGFELRNKHFKGSNSPKNPTFIDRHSTELSVFEGFFDFLSFQVLTASNSENTSNHLVLNSLAFFDKSRSLMERHGTINLYLDRNAAGMEYTQKALSWDPLKYKDQSKFLENGQDLNDFLVAKCAKTLLREEPNRNERLVQQKHRVKRKL